VVDLREARHRKKLMDLLCIKLFLLFFEHRKPSLRAARRPCPVSTVKGCPAGMQFRSLWSKLVLYYKLEVEKLSILAIILELCACIGGPYCP